MLFALPQRVCVRIRIPLIGTALHLAFSQGTSPQVFSCRCHINSPSRKKKGLILFKARQNFVQSLQDNFCYRQLMLFGIIADTLIQGILHPNAQGFLFCIFGFWSSHLCHSCSHASTAPVYFPCDRKSSCKKALLENFYEKSKVHTLLIDISSLICYYNGNNSPRPLRIAYAHLGAFCL